tara:strand:+ start:41 stop:268 length:228 start_codon:yes stop_codon:yes gene_type:complete
MIKDAVKGKEADPKILSLITVYSLSKALAISPLEIYKMPVSLVKDLLAVHITFETLKAEEMDKMQKDMERKSRGR